MLNGDKWNIILLGRFFLSISKCWSDRWSPVTFQLKLHIHGKKRIIKHGVKWLLPKPMSVFNSMSSMVSHQGRNAFSASVRSKRDLRTSPSSAAIAMMESLLAFTTIVYGVFQLPLITLRCSSLGKVHKLIQPTNMVLRIVGLFSSVK